MPTFHFFQTQATLFLKKFSLRYNLHTAKWTRFLCTVWWILTKACTPGTHSPTKKWSISIFPERSIPRSHFVFKLFASECFFVEIIKAKCVGREASHQSSTTNPGSEGSKDVQEPAQTCLQGWALIKCQGAFPGRAHGSLSAALLALDHVTEIARVSFLVLFFGIRVYMFRKREVEAG